MTYNRHGKEDPLDRMIKRVSSDIYQGLNEFMTEHIDYDQLIKMFNSFSIPAGAMSSRIPNPYQVLGLDKTNTDEEIKQRYREIMSKIHPDKAGKGLTFLTQFVNMAYEAICKERGIK